MAGFIDSILKNSIVKDVAENVKKLATLGLRYNDDIVKNSKSIGPTQAAFGVDQQHLDDDIVYALSMADTNEKKYIAVFDTDYPSKREFLRKFALNSEIDWILDTITDEAIVYDDKNYFVQPLNNLDTILKEDILNDVKSSLSLNFKKIYSYFNFQSGILAWQLFRQFLIDGFLAFEIIYNSEGTKIIAFKEIDPISLEPQLEKTPDGYRRIWIQYPEQKEFTRKLYDSQVIYISYAKGSDSARVSYIERLVRNHNLMRLMEHTRAIWNIMNSTFRLKMIIPVGGNSRHRGEESLNQVMAKFKEDIFLNPDSGELKVNGKAAMQFYRNYLLPKKDGDSPEIETLAGEGPELRDVDIINYFYDKLKMDSKIPYSRFDKENGSSYGISADGTNSAEIAFFKFINRLRSIFQEILIKPLSIQMVLDHPDLANDEMFISNIGLEFNKDSVFEELKTMELVQKRVEYISSLKDLKDTKDENPIFSARWLMLKLGFSEEDLIQNQKLLDEDMKAGSDSDSDSDY
jgi:uncharacterized protein YihD (DUF1040 family)